MDSLKALIEKKRKAISEEFHGKKYAKVSELEEARLRKLREEEEQERLQKVRSVLSTTPSTPALLLYFNTSPQFFTQEAKKPKTDTLFQPGQPNSQQRQTTINEQQQQQLAKPALSRHEIIRRLRVLEEPATLFGETDDQRWLRLLVAEKNLQVDDETTGGQQENMQLLLQRKGKPPAAKKSPSKTDLKSTPETMPMTSSSSAGIGELGDSKTGTINDDSNNNNNGALQITTTTTPALDDPGQIALMASFKAAAVAVAEQNMPVEDRIIKWLKKWSTDWEADMDSRSDDIKKTAAGKHATLRFEETMQYLKPLYLRLKHKNIDPELLAGISLIVQAMKDRNYIHANKIYLGLAIGNSPWPIGVTQVGLHERSAREKISFKGTSGKAHIMNDEATRKYIQALKRLITFCQRKYPTDPSFCVDFDAVTDQGRGAAGGGSDRLALLEAMARDEVKAPSSVSLAIATGSKSSGGGGGVQVPQKWDQMIKGALKEIHQQDADDKVAENERGGK